MAIQLTDSIFVGQQKPVEDKYYNVLSPYTSTSQVNTTLLSSIRYRGLTVNIAGVEYWYKDGIADGDLVIKGGAITVKDEGTNIDTATAIINFTGAGVTASGPGTGTVTVNIPGGGGASSCGDILKIAAVSGKFNSSSPIPPFLSNMIVGNLDLGWSHGAYSAEAKSDGFGNMQSLAGEQMHCLIPLPADFLIGDVIKICGIATSDVGNVSDPDPHFYNFYLSVSTVNCQGLGNANLDGEISVNTLISPQTFPFTLKDGFTTTRVCFSASTTITSIVPGCTTYLLVGLNAGSDIWTGQYTGHIYFSYTLDGVKYCGGGTNLFIRNCCEPLYSEVIANNGVPVGESFSDADGNCWTVVSETVNNITGIRVKATSYVDCTACITANPCPLNYLIDSCCTAGPQIFSASISSSLSVGDAFVDDDGFCWTVTGTTALPSSYVVTAVTVYSGASSCVDCTNANTCPQFIVLDSCCNLGQGFTTPALLSAGGYTPTTYPTVIVDQFGYCWIANTTLPKAPPGGFYTNLGFIEAVSEYIDCDACKLASSSPDPCVVSLYYTLRNCCTEEIFVVILNSSYSINTQLTILATETVGCFSIVSWSGTGTETLSNVVVIGTADGGTSSNAIKSCVVCYNDIYTFGCYGSKACFRTIRNVSGVSSTITYVGCDGVYHYNQSFPADTAICVMWWDSVYTVTGAWVDIGEACRQVFNPSATENIIVDYNGCGGPNSYIILAPGDSTPCASCFQLRDPDLTTVRWQLVTPNIC